MSAESSRIDEGVFEIRPRNVELESGHCWLATVPPLAPGDSEQEPRTSRLQLMEDGKPLGPAHARHDDIRTRGGGVFSHWGDDLYFSTSDNSDPRTSGRKYTVTGPRRQGYVPHRNVLRGYEVVPSFIGQPLLDADLLAEMEHHPQAVGKSSWGTRNLLHALTLSLRPGVVLEIGAHIGSASVVIGTALKANNYGRLYCLEPADQSFSVLTEFVEKAGVSEYVRPLKLLSTSPELDAIVRDEVDLIYLDANHSYSNASEDLRVCDRLLADNGLIVLDDVGPEVSPQIDPEGRGGVRQALLDFTRRRPDLHVILLEPPFWLNPCGLGLVCKQTITSRKARLGEHFARAIQGVMGRRHMVRQ